MHLIDRAAREARTVYFAAFVLQPQRFARLHGLLGEGGAKRAITGGGHWRPDPPLGRLLETISVAGEGLQTGGPARRGSIK